LAERFALIKKVGVYLKEWVNFVDIARAGKDIDLSHFCVGFVLKGVVLQDQNTKNRISSVPDVSINPGSIVLVLGDSGLGKTALMRTLAGASGGIHEGSFAIMLGSVEFNENQYSQSSITGGLGFYHQNHPKITRLTVREILGELEESNNEIFAIFQEYYAQESVLKIRASLNDSFGNDKFSDEEQEIIFLLSALIRGSGLVLIDGLPDVISRPDKLAMIVKARDLLAKRRSTNITPTLIISARPEPEYKAQEEVQGSNCITVMLSDESQPSA
jgi:ABC-type lipoprotein export system ATPase subunit